uniref:Uncharacterized protein n=1 Tax=Oryza barthii TaxID=65489 RepID=A0A0D3GI33_9ORYZ
MSYGRYRQSSSHTSPLPDPVGWRADSSSPHLSDLPSSWLIHGCLCQCHGDTTSIHLTTMPAITRLSQKSQEASKASVFVPRPAAAHLQQMQQLARRTPLWSGRGGARRKGGVRRPPDPQLHRPNTDAPPASASTTRQVCY